MSRDVVQAFRGCEQITLTAEPAEIAEQKTSGFCGLSVLCGTAFALCASAGLAEARMNVERAEAERFALQLISDWQRDGHRRSGVRVAHSGDRSAVCGDKTSRDRQAQA
jgi:hypothetical protein